MSVRFGIVGVGGIAEIHARAIEDCAGAQLVACHTRNVRAGARFAADHGCVYTESLDDLLARGDCDAIAITSPSGTHAQIGIAAARHGKHVLCEKPLDITVERIDALIAACNEQQVCLGAIFQGRFAPGALALKTAIERGRFGRLTQCSAQVLWWRDPEYYARSQWRGTWELDGGGALMNQGIHAVDLLLWLAGGVREVSARAQTRIHDIEVEDNLTAWLEFDSGALGTIQASTASYPGSARRIDIRGEHGSVTLVDDAPVLWQFDHSAPEDARFASLGDDSQYGTGTRHGTEMLRGAEMLHGGGAAVPLPASAEGHRAQYEDFVAAIEQHRPPTVAAAAGRAAVELVRAVYESSRSGAVVRLHD
ncbi:Gfo/Idh/MocA family oxidoreductase [Parafrigoribacterium mesophilum]|uniref:Gfo/Idh/MocA family protein n=1 Tax=Parafrigoribacterium mesophilum TaxID=433646 RepID=UPI0031FE02EA